VSSADEIAPLLKRTSSQTASLLEHAISAGLITREDEVLSLSAEGEAFVAAIEAETIQATFRASQPFAPFTEYTPERWWPD
jgi:hypothetical protein